MNLFDYLDVDAETVLDIIENKDSYYFTYHQRKRSGKYRKINVPNAALKGIQRAILYKILYKFSAHPIAHGFVKGKSPITNAKCHVGASALINIDLQNFFNTITESKVSSTLESLLPNLDIKNLKIDEMDHIIIASLLCYKDILIQGGPASPTMSNLVMYSFDTKLLKLIDKYNNAVVTRYADDISVSIHSSDTPDYKHMKEIASKISILLNDESLRINYSKLKFYKKYSRMSVTGIVINEKLNVKRDDWRKFRACLHNIIKTGSKPDEIEMQRLRGYAEWVKTLNQNRGRQFLKELEKIYKLPTNTIKTA